MANPFETMQQLARRTGAPAPTSARADGRFSFVTGLADESASQKEQRANLNAQGTASGNFAGVGEQGFGELGQESAALREAMRRRAAGQDSISAEQLRQGLQQNLSAQRSMAASATPQNAAMAARTAAINMGRQGMGLSGQTAMAGIQERAAAEQALAQMLMQQRQQELQAALGARGNAITAFGGIKPEGSTLEKWGGAISAGANLVGRK